MPNRWPPETQAQALDLYTTHGLAEAHRRLGIPKSTIRGWASAAGIEAAQVAARSGEQTRAATAASVRRRELALAEVRERLVDRLARQAEEALALEAEMVGAQLAALRAARRSRRGEAGEALAGRVAQVMAGPRLSNVVGSRTRAIHDLQLLTDNPTEQPVATGLTIVFATPAPSAAGPAPRIIDLDPEESP